MSEEDDKSVEQESPDESSGPRGGERLAEARRAKQISVLEVAKELHLDEPKVRALERNDFDVLGAPVFAKGHLRKYAQLVGVDADDVFADYYQMTRAEALPPVVIGRPKVRQEASPGPWIAVIIVILVAATSYWWFAVRSETADVPETAPEELPQPEQSGNDAAPVDDPVVLAVAQPIEAEVVDEPARESARVPDQDQPLPEPVEMLAAGETRLLLNYTGDCWTEITDASGRRLFFDMGHNGRTVELTGQAPFNVLFGNFENVSVSVDGTNFPISASNPGSRTARLTILNQ